MSITIQEMQKQVFNLAKEKGWWPIRDVSESGFMYEGGERASSINFKEVNIPEKIALMHSELSEALEFYRGRGIDFFYSEDDKGMDTKPDGFWIELADCMIRIMDLAGAYDVDMEAYIKMKHEYNKTRPYRHGGKKC